MDYNKPVRESATTNYEELLGKGILDEIDLQPNHKIMNFSNKHQPNTIKSTKTDIGKTFVKTQANS